MSDEDTTGLPPFSQGARLALAGLNDEETIYQVALMVFATFNRYASIVPHMVYEFAGKMASHALLDLEFHRGAPVPMDGRKITNGMRTMPENVRVEFAGISEEECIQRATIGTLVVLADPELPEVTIGMAARNYTHSMLELGFQR